MSGLPSSVDGVPDADLSSKFCEEELSIRPNFKRDSCRRLGRMLTTRIHPLLITLYNQFSVADLLRCASELRHSSVSEVNGNVYINADLTQAEASVAFEQRMPRREKKLRRSAEQRDLFDQTNVSSQLPSLDAVPKLLLGGHPPNI